MPKISIILPFYNAEKTLTETCKSISNQSFTNFECIIINNNSTDRSKEIANSWTEKDQRFILTNEIRQGVAYASVKGSNLAQGEYIARMDADDIMLPDRLKLQCEFLDRNKSFGAVGGLVKFGGDIEKAKGIKRFVDWNNQLKTPEQIKLFQFSELPVINPTLMWRKSVEEKYGGYKHGDFPEDYELLLRWLAEGVEISKVNEEVIVWNDPPERLTRTDERYSFDAFYKIKAKYVSQWLKKHCKQLPNVYVWGASRLARKRSKYLEQYGIQIKSYIDISTKRDIVDHVIHFEEIPQPSEAFILVYTPQTDIKTKIAQFLSDKGFINGAHYIFVA